jgi:hypothetical protein
LFSDFYYRWFYFWRNTGIFFFRRKSRIFSNLRASILPGINGFFWTKISATSKVKSMKQTKQRWNTILWVEAFGFSTIILLTWLTEAIGLPHLIFGEPFTVNWHRALLRTAVILLVWLWVHLVTRRLLKRLHYLEKFLQVCGWCRKVSYKAEWLTLEQYFDSKFATHTSHGLCPECMENELKGIKPKKAW